MGIQRVIASFIEESIGKETKEEPRVLHGAPTYKRWAEGN